MKKLTILSVFGIASAMAGGAPVAAHAATIRPYDQSAFVAAQKADDPILVFIEASWCPTCTKERPILKKLYGEPKFSKLQVFNVNFDTEKPLLRKHDVRMQSTLIVYRGTEETGRMTGGTDPAVIKHLLRNL